MKTIFGAGGILRVLGDEQFSEEFFRAGDGRNAGAAAGPTHLATAVQTVLGADCKRGETGGTADGLGGALIHANVALGHGFGVHAADAAEVGVDREVAALEAVIESGEEREIGTVRGERLEERRQREVATGRGGKKCGLVEAQHVADSDHALWASRADGGAGFARDAETGAEHAGR